MTTPDTLPPPGPFAVEVLTPAGQPYTPRRWWGGSVGDAGQPWALCIEGQRLPAAHRYQTIPAAIIKIEEAGSKVSDRLRVVRVGA